MHGYVCVMYSFEKSLHIASMGMFFDDMRMLTKFTKELQDMTLKKYSFVHFRITCEPK